MCLYFFIQNEFALRLSQFYANNTMYEICIFISTAITVAHTSNGLLLTDKPFSVVAVTQICGRIYQIYYVKYYVEQAFNSSKV